MAITTHVLDNVLGTPARGLVIEFYVCGGSERRRLKTTITGVDGRPAEALSGLALPVGVYELVFHAGSYLRSKGFDLPSPAFVDEIVVRFGISDPDAHYHIPLLLSPYGYSTYRGS